MICAHTLGVTHCDGIMDRLYVNRTVTNPKSEVEFVKYLKEKCPKDNSTRFTTQFDLDPTPQTFDNKYFVNILNDPKSIGYVKKFANDKEAFFRVFSSGYVKLSTIGVLTGDKGIIRNQCNILPVSERANNGSKNSCKIQSTAAAVLRLVSHDCQVGGCDGSVLLNIKDKNHQAEFDSPKNFGIRNRELIDKIKSKVEAVCPKQVSCADILVLAARDGVAIAGGPHIKVPLGRKDTKIPHTKQQADVGLPRNNVDLAKAVQVFFKEAGITYEETIAILDNSTRFTTQFDLDPTPQTFDNKYFANILKGHGVIALDAEIARDPRSIGYVKKFAHDQEAFFRVFSSGFVRLSTLGVLTGDQGIIREQCNVL
ncbi:hypothetical protein ACJIZ3_015030 [Penstemon smallii]|uniref:Peroxidase n=1 Tax=Penstemon smallii TaxID=265156 RepID=A0ABD3RLB1_9LAMI